MKETILSTNERSFVEKAISESLRIDKRQLNEFRNLGIFFGKNYGSVVVSLGETKVFTSVSCEISTPKTTRPNEGTIFINVEMGSINQNSEACIVITRILERTIRDSRCVDLEALCIIAEDKVWNLRVDIAVLNNEGNIIDCACIAAISALAHFRRPDCTTSGDGEFIIHKASEKDFIPTVLHHYPVCITYALFDGKIPVADPTVIEERTSNASISLAINSYKEICSMHLTGVTLTSPFLIQKCAEMASDRAKHIVEFIKSSLEQDHVERETGEVKGFSQSIRLTSIVSNFHEAQVFEKMMEESESESQNESSPPTYEDKEIQKIDNNTVASDKWKCDSNSENGASSSEDEDMKEVQVKSVKISAMETNVIDITSDDDEEKDTIILS